MQGQSKQLEQILSGFSLSLDESLISTYSLSDIKGEDDKKLKKKLKKYVIEETDSNEVAAEKVAKMLQEFAKNYETTAKVLNKVSELKKTVDQGQKQKNNSLKQKQLTMNLHKSFKGRYDEELKKAQQVEKQQQLKRKQVIESLQQKIKLIQSQYEEAGKIKIQKFRQNQHLKHQTSRLQPHLIASESLYDAQLKKKAIQIEIQMTTLKQKIQMMDNFKGMKAETIEKVEKAKQDEQKISRKLKKIGDKQDEHKILLAKAHLVFEDYKKAIQTLKTVLPKKQKQANETRVKALKAQNSLKEVKKQILDLDTEIENHLKQKQVLQTLQNNLLKQLEQNK